MHSDCLNCISFIMPTLNEEKHICGVLESIRDCIGTRFRYEVLVVDNGSSDRTVEIATKNGAICQIAPDCNISSLRNLGGAKATSDVLVFLDADVYLTAEWGVRIESVLERLHNQPCVITGSHCGISSENSWIELVWFEPRTKNREVSYINSGHLIVDKKFFLSLGGFDSDLETGEDYEFCVRAKSKGARIENDPDLRVVHEGYPKSIKSFFKRERWHARGDYASFKSIFSSKPATVSTFNLSIIILCVICGIIMPNALIFFVLVYILIFSGICVAATISRCRDQVSFVVFSRVVILYMVYFTARTVSVADVCFKRIAGGLAK